MNLKNIKLVKCMTKNEVNELTKDYILLEDEIYMGVSYRHNWKCKCGGIIEGRTWDAIKQNKSILCSTCKHNEIELRYKTEVEKTGDYEYIRAYFKHDVLPNGRVVGDSPYIQVKHKYCGSIYETNASGFINRDHRCSKCCHKYENSFAYHIEQELGESLDKYWDFDKNTVNPYYISKYCNDEVWIKCKEKDYHGSYEIMCGNFINGVRCGYCYNRKVHPLDSFGQYLQDNNLLHLWSDKNDVDPFTISKSSSKKVWMLCDNKYKNEINNTMKRDYHGDYEVARNNFIAGNRCPYCINRKIHKYDSFGYLYPEKAKCWHEDNDKNPYEVAPSSGKKFKFRCDECGHEWNITPKHISEEKWCPKCASSKGEKRIKEYLDRNNIRYIHDEPYFKDLLSDLGNPLRPDFILPEPKIWIEYDGEFHFKKMFKGDNYETLKIHDKRKNEYAKKHGWKMVRIPYTKFDEIEIILKEFINNK
ncbi:hypothetical protein UT300012_31630 [Paraclostridium bifermentans]